MAEVWIMGEMLVEIMRPEAGCDMDVEGVFRGPFPSGAPAICIDTVARLGHSCGIIGGVGKDGFGKCLLERLGKDGVDTRFVRESETTSTGVAFVTYFEDGSRKYIFHMGNSAAVQCEAPSAEELGDVKFLHVMGCSLMAEETFAGEILKVMDSVLRKGGKVSFDPNIRTELLHDPSVFDTVRHVLENTSVFLPGEEELLLLTGEKTIEKAVEACFKNPKLEVLALKQGSRGCTVHTRDGVYQMGIYQVEAKDATGAGDSYDGAFLCGLLEGKPMEEVMKMAAAAGALNTAAFGPMEGNISKETVREMIEKGA
ncbi:MAG: sugar kinase [Lachnospiraceae bacterium]|nr:sugar kinase [Lachnospiraceae bacterium]MCI9487079.1 sugar kinase [Lachnospiraceae bacterium]